jgi:hypothetical protein
MVGDGGGASGGGVKCRPRLAERGLGFPQPALHPYGGFGYAAGVNDTACCILREDLVSGIG